MSWEVGGGRVRRTASDDHGLCRSLHLLRVKGGGERVHGRGVSHSPARARAAFTWYTPTRPFSTKCSLKAALI